MNLVLQVYGTASWSQKSINQCIQKVKQQKTLCPGEWRLYSCMTFKCKHAGRTLKEINQKLYK